METSLFYFSQSFCAVTNNITFSLAIKQGFPKRFVILAGWLSHLPRKTVFLQENHSRGFLPSPDVTLPARHAKDKSLLLCCSSSPCFVVLSGSSFLTFTNFC